ncbi:hypothetical protein FOYG_06993 [Fusarium oxysporum NRRL 32931]|uniref:Uncharacterized protein n=1 Tax=Fusarium oxysporum NRRL 32931 TaxID=660029 RepID=W9IGR3_FUSOX|nr:hypothetical protein FOYG_06993 [Fusarium oxysporum NRRL 32931]KAJ0136917.1 Uncharacterized protein HZ326_20076 [Fusarium oxysporum f. sp. albedinis]
MASSGVCTGSIRAAFRYSEVVKAQGNGSPAVILAASTTECTQLAVSASRQACHFLPSMTQAFGRKCEPSSSRL